MTLRDLKESVDALRLHPLADTNAAGVTVEGGAVVVEFDTAQIEFDLEETREERDKLATELKECEAERDGFEQRAQDLEAVIEDVKNPDAGHLESARADCDRFRASAVAWSQEVQKLRAEVQAMRKRKGTAAGVCAFSQEVYTLLAWVSQVEGRYKREAGDLVAKINSIG